MARGLDGAAAGAGERMESRASVRGRLLQATEVGEHSNRWAVVDGKGHTRGCVLPPDSTVALGEARAIVEA